MTFPKASNPPAGAASKNDEILPGTVLGDRYRIDALLGQGAMGKVYSAEHILLRKKLAIKILRGDRAQVPEVVARFEREAMAAANIEHPNIAGASDFGRLADGSVYLVLEYVQGASLRDEIQAGPFPLERSLHIGRQIASALAGAQELQIVHRDLKPENIMLVEKHGDPDFVKVLDFGIARVPMAEGANNPLTKVGIVFGTPEYMAPEQALGQRVDGRADLFALGVILFEMIAGVRPYPGGAANFARKFSAKPVRVSERAPGVVVPKEVENIIGRLLAADVRLRFQSATEVLAAFSELKGPASLPGAPARPPEPARAPAKASGVQLPSFLPGDPLPAFDLPSEPLGNGGSRPTPPLASGAVVKPEGIGNPEPPEAPTLHRAPSLEVSGLASASEQPEIEAHGRVAKDERRFSILARTVLLRGRSLHATCCALIDQHRERLPRFVRRRIKRVPAATLLVSLLGLATLGVLLVVIALAVGEPQAREVVPPGGELESAVAPEGVGSSLSAPPVLVEPVREDATTQLQLALARVGDGKAAEAIGLLGRALSSETAVAEDPRTAEVFVQSLRLEAERVEDAAFALLQGPMGQHGADLLYEVSLDAKIAEPTRARARAWLGTKEFERVSSPALYSAVKLRQASRCEQKHHLLKLAGNVGGKHTLEYLRELQKSSRCEPDDSAECYPCLAADDRLEQTIRLLEQSAGR